MNTGAHMANGPIAPEDLRLFTIGDFRAGKVMHYHHAADVLNVKTAGGEVVHVTARLPDFPLPNTSDLPGVYARMCMESIRRMYPVGVRDWQVDNEPQYTWGNLRAGPWRYQYYMRLAVEELRHSIAAAGFEGVRLLSPPLSWSPALWRKDLGSGNPTDWTLDEWLQAFTYRPYAGAPNMWQCFDGVSANCYWQNERQMKDGSFGAHFIRLHEMAGGQLPIVITEAGNSLRDKKPRPTDAEIEAAQVRDYPAYVDYVSMYPFVESVHFFILGGTDDWAGFHLTEPICEALRCHN